MYTGEELQISKDSPVWILDGIKTLAENIAFTLTLPVYVTAIQSSGLLLSAVFGYIFFKENISKKVFPILIIIAGVVLITFSQG